MNHPLQIGPVRSGKRLPALCGACAVLLGSLVLGGWVCDIGGLKGGFPGLAPIAANTAFAMLLAGLSLWQLRIEGAGLIRRRIGQVFALLVTLIGALTLAEYVLGRDLGIDPLVFWSVGGPLESAERGRMAPATAGMFAYLGLALLLFDVKPIGSFVIAELLTVVAAVSSWLPMLAYAYRIHSPFQVSRHPSVALSSAVVCLVLSVGLFSARPARGWAALVMSDTVGGGMIRRLLPALTGIFVVIGFLRVQGQRDGLFGWELGAAIMVLCIAVMSCVIIGWTGQWLNRIDQERREAEEARLRVRLRTVELTAANDQLLQEIAQRRQTEADLAAVSARLEAVLSAATEVSFIATDPNGCITVFNAGAERLLGYAAEEMIGKQTPAIIHCPDEVAAHGEVLTRKFGIRIAGFEVFVAHARRGGHEEREWTYIRKDGKRLTVSLVVTAQRDGNGRVIGFLGVAKDVTARKRAEEALRDSEERYRTVVEDQTEIVSRLLPDGTFTFVSDVFCRFFGKTQRELLNRCWHPNAHADDVPYVEARLALLSPENPVVTTENRVIDGNGQTHWMEFVNRAFFTPAGDLREIQSVGRDISERKRAEEQVLASLKEKEVLLKEIHHRVKNNLQIVSTLLDLQADQTGDLQAVGMFQESRGRVRSMALIHERLYRSDNLAQVKMGEYIERLAEDLYQSYRSASGEVEFVVAAERALFPLDVAIPCGLLLNELLTNCLKHAFPAGRDGTVTIDLRRGSDNTSVLTVRDDGAGFPDSIDFRDTTSFGLQLVNMLVEQLGGEIELLANKGTCFTITFPFMN
jgi:PAS domain S-box-containing protein